MSLKEGDKDHAREIAQATKAFVLGDRVEDTKTFVEGLFASVEAHIHAKIEFSKLVGTCARCEADIPPGGRQLIHPITKEVKFSALCEKCSKEVAAQYEQHRKERKHGHSDGSGEAG